jgi:hypothetical protein
LTFGFRFVLLSFMALDASTTERHRRNLARLEELAMALAGEAQARAMASQTQADFHQATRDFDRAARSARQCMALASRLERDGARAAREEAEHREGLVKRRRRRLEAALERGFNIADRDMAESFDFTERLDAFLSEETHAPAFLSEPYEAQVQRIAEALGVPLPLPPRSGEGEDRGEGGSPQPAPGAYERDFWNSA